MPLWGSEIRDLLQSQHRHRARSNCIDNNCDKVAHQLHFWHITRKKEKKWGLKISSSILFPVPTGDKSTSCLANSANKNRRSENKHLCCRSCFITAPWILTTFLFILFPEYLWVYYCGHLPWAPITQAVALCLAPVSFGPQRLLSGVWLDWRLEQRWCYDTLTCKHYSPSQALVPGSLCYSPGHLTTDMTGSRGVGIMIFLKYENIHFIGWDSCYDKRKLW